jgi:hypothetical protein
LVGGLHGMADRRGKHVQHGVEVVGDAFLVHRFFGVRGQGSRARCQVHVSREGEARGYLRRASL